MRKTTSEIYEQSQRIWQLFAEVKRSAINKADPRTGGNDMLCNNWGNEEARKVREMYNKRRDRTLPQIIDRHYNKAFRIQYPDHNFSKSYFNL